MKTGKAVGKGVAPIPEGYHTITSSLAVRGGEKAIEFYKKAFGAEELGRMYDLDGQMIVHAELRIGDSRIFLSEESPAFGTRSPESLGGTAATFYLYVEDADAVFRKPLPPARK